MRVLKRDWRGLKRAKNENYRSISRYISETTEDRSIVTMEDCNKTDDDDDDDDDDNDGFRNDHGRPTRNWYVF